MSTINIILCDIYSIYFMKKVLLIGDLIQDTFIFGSCEKLNPEGPTPLVKQQKVENKPGGAGNVYENLRSLNFAVDFFHSKQVSQKTRIVVNNTTICRLDNDVIGNNLDVVYDLNKLEFTNYSSIVISDYNKGTLDNFQLILQKLRNSKVRIFVDPKRRFENYEDVFCIKCNEKEFKEYFANPTDHNIQVAAEEHNIKLFIVTRGKDGVTYVYDGEVYSIPATSDAVADVTGAGDCFMAALVYALEKGFTVHESIQIANQGAGVCVQHMGTYILKVEDLIKKKIFTNGCFDILHRGHFDLLEKSKALGDYLIVGLNSDKSVRKLKGLTRPINNQEDRKKALESVKYVDEVIIFDEDTPYELITQQKPDIITKGGDYKAEDVVGNDLAIVVIIPFTDGYSTTKILGEK